MKIITLLTVVITIVLSGCINLRPAGSVDLSDLKHWEPVKYPTLGIEIEAPKDRRQEEVRDSQSYRQQNGNRGVKFALHEGSGGVLQETIACLVIYIEVFSREEWLRFLKGEGSSISDGHFDEYDRKFNAHFTQQRGFRKDTISRDGRVALACAIRGRSNVTEGSPEDQEDKAAIKRILNSVRFLD